MTILVDSQDLPAFEWPVRRGHCDAAPLVEYQAAGESGAPGNDAPVKRVRRNARLLLISDRSTEETLADVVALELCAVVGHHLSKTGKPMVIVGHEALQCCAALGALAGEEFAPIAGYSLKGERVYSRSSDETGAGLNRMLNKLAEAGALIETENSDQVLFSFGTVYSVGSAVANTETERFTLVISCADADDPPQSVAISTQVGAQELARLAMALEAVIALPEQRFMRWMI